MANLLYYQHYQHYHCSENNFIFVLFAISAAVGAQCGGPKKSPRTSSIRQSLFSLLSFEVTEAFEKSEINESLIQYLNSVFLKFGLNLIFFSVFYVNCSLTSAKYSIFLWLILSIL